MRWLLVKDLQILRRSPLLVGLLVIYPIAISLLIGFALSRGPEKPKVAFFNAVPQTDERIQLGGREVDLTTYTNRLVQSFELVDASSKADALAKVREGDAVGALIVPEDAARRLQQAVALSGSPEKPVLEFAYNAENPLKAEYVEAQLESTLAQANRALSREVTREAGRYLGFLLDGGEFSFLGQSFDVLGLRRTEQVVSGVLAGLPRDAPERAQLESVRRFAELAIENLDLSDAVLSAVSAPIEIRETVLRGGRTPLDAFAIAVSVAVSLMFVCVLLAAGMLAMEREEHAFGRLVRGLVTRLGLIVEKIGVSALCSFLVGLLMLGVVALFADLDPGRAPQWVAALAAGAIAFGALGVAVGALAREVRAASLLAFGLALPLAFLALVPSGAVAEGLFDLIRVVSALFPFKPTLQALDAAINGAEPGLLRPILHLAALTVVFATIARLALRRFG